MVTHPPAGISVAGQRFYPENPGVFTYQGLLSGRIFDQPENSAEVSAEAGRGCRTDRNMNLEKYPYVSKSNHKTFLFESVGPKGKIRKRVIFSLINEQFEDIYNLSFGDRYHTKSGINDKIISNNGDRTKVLATVALTVLEFFEHFPNAIVYIEGSTPSRTRLYQIEISAHLMEIYEFFDIYGFNNGKFEKFRIGTNYEAFLIQQNKKRVSFNKR